jgi:DNA-binding SARP family transcriptional activator
MEIRVLGPLMVRHNYVQAVPNARKPRQVFSLLSLSYGELVPTTGLLQELWDSRPPKSALTTLQSYIYQLRKHLAEALVASVADVSRSILQTRNGGYVLDSLGGGFLDLFEYRHLEKVGLQLFQSQDDAAAVETFGRALGLWRGPALADISHGRLLEAEVASLERSKMTLVECRLEAELRLGRHRETLSELAALVMRHNYNENLHSLYMLALHRSGDRTTALDVYHRLRSSMVDELGLEPSPWLQRLHHALIAAAPRLDERAAQWQMVN